MAMGSEGSRGRGRGGLVCRLALPPLLLRTLTAGELIETVSTAFDVAAAPLGAAVVGLRGLVDRVLGPLPPRSSPAFTPADDTSLPSTTAGDASDAAAARDLVRGEAGAPTTGLTWRVLPLLPASSAWLSEDGEEYLGGRLMRPGVWARARC